MTPLRQAGPMVAPGGAAADAAFASAACNLAKAIVGAGMVALPSAFLALGGLLGTALLLAVGALVYRTKAAVVDAAAAQPRAKSYAALAAATCGRGAGLATQAAVVAFCFGFLVVDLVVVADVLTGSPPDCNGLVCLVTGIVPADRRLVVLAVSGGAVAPLLLLRSMDRLSGVNYAGMASALLLAVVAVGLGASALARGVAHALPLLPPPGGLDPERLASTAAVVLTAFVAHQGLLPALALLEPRTPGRARAVVAAALAVACAAYLALAAGAALAFGPATRPDVLENFSAAAMAPLLGGEARAALVAAAVQGAYAVSVIASAALFMHPLRTAVAELAWGGWGREGGGRGSPSGGGGDDDGSSGVGRPVGVGAAGGAAGGDWQDPEAAAAAGVQGSGGQPPPAAAAPTAAEAAEARHYLPLTYGLLAAATAVAVMVPDIWAALSAVGDSAAAVEAFIVPGLMAMALHTALRGKPRAGRQPVPPGDDGAAAPLLAEDGPGGRTGGPGTGAHSLLGSLAAAFDAAWPVLVCGLGAALLLNGAAELLLPLARLNSA